ncbi:Family 55 glycoside hydrolase [Madurella fahalii]|uniref:Family 55 glycoside hydrolase n=1 Tax=Madurella fahalii TaxID=1157608 RepID=A0ABQ0GCS9_9PEZI
MRNSGMFGATGQPAVVYFPAGEYLVSSTIRSDVGTLIMGDPTNLPNLKAAATFNDTYLLIGHGQHHSGLVGFFHGIKNWVLDSSLVPSATSITLLEWTVSQNNLLSNVAFNMPLGAQGHIGLATPGIGSALIMNDLQFTGGEIGVLFTATQYHLKSLHFKNVRTGVRLASVLQATAQGLTLEGCEVGIDASSGSGMLNLIDCTASNTTTVVAAADSDTVAGSLVLENVVVDDSAVATVKTNSAILLQGSTPDNTAWIRANIYPPSNSSSPDNPIPSPTFCAGQLIPVSRPEALTNPLTKAYHTRSPPTYASYPLSKITNIKSVSAHPVHGNGIHDDTASLQAIVTAAAASGNILYFPHGIYRLTDTFTLPPGSRLVGEAWTQLSAAGAKFADADHPRPMIQVGRRGAEERGVAHMSDFLLTVAEVLPGAVLVEVNMAGEAPGDVGFWNVHMRIGGARGTAVQCARPEGCLAARLMVHLRRGSGSYWENTWGWTADHQLDVIGPPAGGEVEVYPGTGAGWLVGATEGTWILGAGVEHNVLYQVNIHKAENVFIGLQQGEAAYWQGAGNKLLAPEPWADSLLPSDPDYDWCGAEDVQCCMGLYQLITESRNINIYSSGFWNFVAGPDRTMCTDDCQDSAALYESNSKLYVYGLSTVNNKNLILEKAGNTTTPVATRVNNAFASLDGYSRQRR